MKLSVLIFALVAISQAAFAGPKCTDEPKEKWLDQKAFQQKLIDQKYKIKVFKVTKGDCYEIYGWDEAGKKVEIYFNPVSGAKVKEVVN
jgi:hypothetical protein